MTENEGRPFWERLDDEPPTAYQSFCVYRDAGITRSLRKAASTFYQEQGEPDDYRRATEGLPTGAQLTRFKRWSTEWMWVARCEAFDAEEARQRSLRLQQEREEMLDRHRSVAMLGEKLASKVMYDLLRDEGYFPPSALPSLISASTQLHRLSLGEPSEIAETRAKDPDARPPEPDFSALTDDELDELERLGRKVWGD